MIKNIFRALGFHIIYLLILGFLFMTGIPYIVGDFSIVVGLRLSVLIYIFCGTRLLNDTGSLMKNSLSGIGILIIGILIWEFCFSGTNFDLKNPNWFDRAEWLGYFFYISPFYQIDISELTGNLTDRQKYIMDILYLLVPNILLLTGIYLKKAITKIGV